MKRGPVVIALVAIAVVLVAGVYFMNNQSATTSQNQTENQTTQTDTNTSTAGNNTQSSNQQTSQQTQETETNTQEQQTASGNDTTETSNNTETTETVDNSTQTTTQQASSSSNGSGSYMINEIVFVEESDFAKTVNMMAAGEMDVYANGTTEAALVQQIETSDALGFENSYGGYQAITINPVGPTFPDTGKLNPFNSKKIREALNWLIDRNYIVDEIYGGLASAKYFPLHTAFPDYARMADVARVLEKKYAYDPEKANEIITAEMLDMGAEQVDGKWQYNGEPVEIIMLNRVEDERRDVGDYVGNVLEEIGFAIDRQYKTSSEAATLWSAGNPAEGKWHLYTAGWSPSTISRDQGSLFTAFYTPSGSSRALYQAMTPSEDFVAVADRLVQRDFGSMEERAELMAEALELAMQDSAQVWTVDLRRVIPRRAEMSLTTDIAGGLSSSSLWPYTIRTTNPDKETITFGSPVILNDPWNPIAGSTWVYDRLLFRATGVEPLLPDPYTGLYHPQTVEKAKVIVEEGIPVTQSLDWVELAFEPVIEVPEDAWVDWDAENGSFITRGSKYPDGLTSKTKSVIYFDPQLLETKWHDGTMMDMGDMLMPFIMYLDRGTENGAIYDEAFAPAFGTFMGHFRGLRVIESDPVVVEVYSERPYLDAEWIATARTGGPYVYPWHNLAAAPWHTLALGILAEQGNELAFSSTKADKMEVEWLNMIAGPSLEILEKYRVDAMERGFIPYENVLGEYITAEYARSRYQALGDWYEELGHFWVGNGPFFLDEVHPVEKILTLKRYDDFIDPPDKWMRFASPRLPEVEVDGPNRVNIGEAATFDIHVNFEGEAYLNDDLSFVKFLVFDSRGELAVSSVATPSADGLWQVSLTAEQTQALAVGSNQMEVIVASKLVSLPVFETTTFVTVNPS